MYNNNYNPAATWAVLVLFTVIVLYYAFDFLRPSISTKVIHFWDSISIWDILIIWKKKNSPKNK